MKIKVAGATNRQLDWLAAKSVGGFDLHRVESDPGTWRFSFRDDDEPGRIDILYLNEYSPSSDGDLGLYFIRKNKISLIYSVESLPDSDEVMDIWTAYVGSIFVQGPDPLIAAIRCQITSTLGQEVEVPDGL